MAAFMNDFFQCRVCNYPCVVTLRPGTPHYGEIRCPDHGHDWVPKPNSKKRAKRKSNLKLKNSIPEGYNNFCELCMRSKPLLSKLNPPLFLEVHHVIEVQELGSNDPENLRLLCSECHELIHARRRSFNRYRIHESSPPPSESDQ